MAAKHCVIYEQWVKFGFLNEAMRINYKNLVLDQIISFHNYFLEQFFVSRTNIYIYIYI